MPEKSNTSIRLSKAAKVFNVGKDTLVEFLAKKGYQIDPSPNTKLSEDMFAILIEEYGAIEESVNGENNYSSMSDRGNGSIIEEHKEPIKRAINSEVKEDSFKSWSDDEIIEFLKDYWECDDFIFDCKVSDKPYRTERPENYKGAITNLTLNGEIVRYPNSNYPIFYNIPVKTKANIPSGKCRLRFELESREWRERTGNMFMLRPVPRSFAELNPEKVRDFQQRKAESGKSEHTYKEKELFELWGVSDCNFIGYYRFDADSGYSIVDDIRKSNFARIPYYPNDQSKTPISLHYYGEINGIEQNNYYLFNWKLAGNNPANPYEIYIDFQFQPQPIRPRWFIEQLFNDRYNDKSKNFESSTSFLDTLSKQLSAKESTFIYELLQNANDYPVEGVPVDVEFHITDKYLLFMHSGDYFNVRNISGICGINEKEKTANIKTIGYKGIGFKTVFLNNHFVYIKTGDYSFRFEDQSHLPIVKRTIKRLEAPWPILPIWTEDNELPREVKSIFNAADKKYRVKIALKPDDPTILHSGRKNYEELFKDVFDDSNLILFIPNIRSVKVFINGELVRDCFIDESKWLVSNYEHPINEDFQALVNKAIETGKSRIPEKYKDFEQTKVSFACKREGRKLIPIDNTTLYCYLPTSASWGFPFLLNTDMIPRGDRDDIEREVYLKGEDDTNFNLELAYIAGEKFFYWIKDLLESGKYDYDTIFALIPDFDECIKSHEKYDDFITKFKDGFEKNLKEKELVPVLDNDENKLICVSKIILDRTGISETGFFTDSDILFFANNGKEWTSNPDEFFPHPMLRGQQHFKAFIEKYHDEDMEFGLEQILIMCSNGDFMKWLSVQSNNNKYLEYLLSRDYLSDFIEKGKPIFIGDNEKLYDAADMYYDIDKHLGDLSCFSKDYLLRISLATRDYFKDNEEWVSQTEDAFKVFYPCEFVSDVIDDYKMKSLLREKSSSIAFFHFLAINNIVNPELVDLPFINCNGEIIEDFDRLVFFESERGSEVKNDEWLDDDWMEFISNDYITNDNEICSDYLKSQLKVLEYSDKVIVDRIIKDPDKTALINSCLDEIDTAAPFIDFVTKNANEFEAGSLSAFDVIAVSKDGEEVYGKVDGNTFFSSILYDELEQKEWVSDGWMYSLSNAYFVGKSNEETKSMRSVFAKAFGVREIQKVAFVDDILLQNIDELKENLANADSNIDFWRWIKQNCKDKVASLRELPVIATNAENEERDYVLSSNSIYISDGLLPEGQYIESIVKKYYDDSLFVIPRYAENNTVAVKKSWRLFFEELGVLSDQTELVFDQIIPNLSEIEDLGVPSMLAKARDYFKERGITISDLTSLRLEKQDGEYDEVRNCLFISTKKGEEPFKDIKLKNECVISQYDAETRALLLEIAAEANATVIENLEDWRSEKIAQYLKMQAAAEITDEIHFRFVKELLDIDEKEKGNLSEDIRKIKLLAKDGLYYNQEALTLGKEYRPLCDFESNGITDNQLTYLNAGYASLDCENLGKKIRSTFGGVHRRFTEKDIDLLSNYTFADFFWRTFLTHKDAPTATVKSMIEDGKFKDKPCVPTPCGKVDCAENLYSRKELKDYMKLVADWSVCYPFDDYPEETYEILELLSFKQSLSFEDSLYALMNTEDQLKRYFLLKWMSEEFDENDEKQKELISNYREEEKSKWRNRHKKKCPIKELYALDIDDKANAKYLEQYFKLHPRVILDDYFVKASLETYYKECKMMQIPVIKWDEMILDPALSERNDTTLKDKLRNYLLLVAAIEHPENWSEYFNSLCEKFNELDFKRCLSISLTYSKDADISQKARKFYYDTNNHLFYYVGEWHDRLVFVDFIDELRDVIQSDFDKDMFRQIFEPKSSIEELEEFTNQYIVDLADDDNFRNILLNQLGVSLSLSEEYEEDEEEPELRVIPNTYRNTTPTESSMPEVDESEFEVEYDHDEEPEEEENDDYEEQTDETTPNETEGKVKFEKPKLGLPTGIIIKKPSNDDFVDVEQENEDDDEDDEPTFVKHVETPNKDNTEKSSSDQPAVSRQRKPRGAYRGKWEPAQQDSPAVRSRRNYSGYSPDKFKTRQFNVGAQEPLTLSRREVSNEEVQYLSNLFGRAMNVDTIKDENYIVRMRFYNSLKESGMEMDMDEKDYVENGSSQVVTKTGKYVHRCSARSGIIYISPTVWNRLREGRWIICFYSGKMADQFVYVKTPEELMEIINQDALVIQVTGNNKQEIVDKIYEDGFCDMDGNIYTLIRTIKVDGEVTPFDENITDYYSNDDDLDTDAL